MSCTIAAHFDGKSIIPDVPLDLSPGQRIQVTIERIDAGDYPLTTIGALATDMGVSDLAEGHQRYAHPAPTDQDDG